MSKRFTDTDKWKKPFIRGMKAPYKLLWFYILDECDHAGIWQVDFDVAEIKIGEKLHVNEAIDSFGLNIKVFSNGEKWFIPDFIEFQYGSLNPENRAHNSVLNILNKYNLIDSNNKIKPLTSPLQGAKDMDKDKDKDKDKEQPPELSEFLEYCQSELKEKFIALKFSIESKYKAWKDNNWRDGYNKPIKKWKSKILNTIPYLKPDTNLKPIEQPKLDMKNLHKPTYKP